jgi:hypothetical protein
MGVNGDARHAPISAENRTHGYFPVTNPYPVFDEGALGYPPLSESSVSEYQHYPESISEPLMFSLEIGSSLLTQKKNGPLSGVTVSDPMTANLQELQGDLYYSHAGSQHRTDQSSLPIPLSFASEICAPQNHVDNPTIRFPPLPKISPFIRDSSITRRPQIRKRPRPPDSMGDALYHTANQKESEACQLSAIHMSAPTGSHWSYPACGSRPFIHDVWDTGGENYSTADQSSDNVSEQLSYWSNNTSISAFHQLPDEVWKQKRPDPPDPRQTWSPGIERDDAEKVDDGEPKTEMIWSRRPTKRKKIRHLGDGGGAG